MPLGFIDIQINGTEVATVNDVVSFDPNKSSVEVMKILGYGAVNVALFGLGNISLSGGCTITKYWDTPEDAWAWFMTAAAQLNGVGQILITKTCVDGTLVAWLFSGVKIIVEVSEPLNLTTITKITFEGPPPALQP